ncbi:MAG: adenylosuccinate lyase [Acholeplasmatales bacterium]|nr:MAG: adenylosuccinate lyase [Acholeplasmatales bacterium]
MIERYRLPAMQALFKDEARYKTFLEVECAVLIVLAEQGMIPPEAAKEVVRKARIDVARIQALEAETRHDVIAFTRAVGETLGDEKQWLHYGLTSTDVVDTALALTLKQANAILLERIETFMHQLRVLAKTYRDTPCIGRTHGMHAEVTTFGLKFALYYDEFKRHLDRFHAVRTRIEVGKISGAVGNFNLVSPAVQDAVCARLGIGHAAISTQTLQRDRHAEYVSVLVLIAASIEKIALEIRHLQRTEVGEVAEGFSAGQKGSSAMPHKRNPIASENMAGCARIMRGYLQPMFENIALWHERDISHSSVERVVLPDAIMLLDYMLARYVSVLKHLDVKPARMRQNIDATHGVVFSQRVLHALIETGMTRESAYDIIQPRALLALEQGIPFRSLLEADAAISNRLDAVTLDACFNPEQALKNVAVIFDRVFEEERV